LRQGRRWGWRKGKRGREREREGWRGRERDGLTEGGKAAYKARAQTHTRTLTCTCVCYGVYVVVHESAREMCEPAREKGGRIDGGL